MRSEIVRRSGPVSQAEPPQAQRTWTCEASAIASRNMQLYANRTRLGLTNFEGFADRFRLYLNGKARSHDQAPHAGKSTRSPALGRHHC